MKSYSKPTKEQIDTAIPLLSSPQHEAYFFKQLQNPYWANALAERDVFKYPPPPKPVEGGGVRYPPWAASEYLSRMAVDAPTEVASILSGIRTENASIVGDVLTAAAEMPPELAASLVPVVCHAIEQGALWIHFEEASSLCARLAVGGEAVSASNLAEALFSPSSAHSRMWKARSDIYRYITNLGVVLPALIKSSGPTFVSKLCNWLTAAIDERKHVDKESGIDYSYMWRPAIEEHAENREYDFTGQMAGLVRSAFEQAIRSGSMALEAAIRLLEKQRYVIFRRIKLHLLNEFGEQEEVTCGTITNRNLFNDFQVKHEYARLVEHRFAMLTGAQQSEWYGWVDSGPESSKTDAKDDSEVSDAAEKKRLEYWKFKRLHWVRSHLTGDHRAAYERMLSEHGEPGLTDFNFRSKSFHWGDESPVPLEELTALDLKGAVSVVTAWNPQDAAIRGPNLEGLASTFSQYVAANPERHSAEASLLIDKSATFVRVFITQMSESIKKGLDVDLEAVLDLCDWVVARPLAERTTPKLEDEALVDKDWQWTRNEISQLLEAICESKIDDRPKYALNEFRTRLWKLLEPLSYDPSTTLIVQDISREDARVHDYLQLGINSPQGKATEAIFEYARWVSNHLKKSNGTQEVVPGGFNAVPEIRDTLERLVAPGNRSFETLSVIGSRMSLIYWIDKEWLVANADAVFQLKGIELTPPTVEGWAAWNAFLVWVRPHIEFYHAFQDQFAYAVEQSAKVVFNESTLEQPMHRLGEHLMLLYGRGQLELENDSSIVRRFMKTAVPQLRTHAIEFVGRTLEADHENQVKLPSEVIERFMKLWDEYWVGAGEGDARENPNAQPFGSWFASGQLPKKWAVERLEQYVEVAPLPEPLDSVDEELARVASSNPVKSIRIIDRIVREDREGWRAYAWLEPAEEILRVAVAAGGEAKSLADKLIDHLGRRGYVQFRALSPQ